MEEKLLNLTNPQKNIWYLEKFYNNSSLNTICGTAFVNEVTDFSLLKESICHIVNNNYSFHLKITLEKNEPKQYYKVMEYDVPIVDVNSKEEYSEYINNKISIPFDIYNKTLALLCGTRVRSFDCPLLYLGKIYLCTCCLWLLRGLCYFQLLR